MPKPLSRAKRWADAAARAISATEELVSIQEAFQEWMDGLPENLQQSPVAEKLDAVTGIDLASAMDALEEAGNADLPLGFGRD